MKKFLLAISLFAASAGAVFAQSITQEDCDRARELVSQMTLREKIDYIGGYDKFYIRGIERLGIPQIRMADGPQGVRNNTRSTLFACGVAAAASWNEALVREMGVALGQDSRARGVHILLGPGVNIYRSPLCGRNFEYMGEDPYLASRAAVNYIKGVQSQGVMATIKHFALNNQEYDRHHVSSDADERTMNEIYFPAFRAAVEEAKVASVMTSYNLVNGVHAAENPVLIRENLRDRWGFKGFVMSDWTSTYSALASVKGGLDLEMPQAWCMNSDELLPLIEAGLIDESEIDAKVQNILQTLIAFGFLDREQLDRSISEDNAYSRDVAYRLSCESAVLLRNEGALPLKPGRRNKVLLMGPNASVIPCGGGSGRVDPIYSISLAEGMKGLGRNWSVSVADGKPSVKELESASAVIVSVGFNSKTEKENSDRTFSLPEGQDELIEYAAAHNRKVSVVIYAGGAVDMSRWKDKVSAIVMGWYPGQEGGKAIANILAGKVNPSGKLPMSFESRLEDNPSWKWYYPREPKTKRGFSYRYVTYGEGIFCGYRGYEKAGIEPAYPFGYGLSYTEFEYSGSKCIKSGDGYDVVFTLSNVGGRDGAEVSQVYVGEKNPCVKRPLKELKGFAKTVLRKGASARVTIHLPASAFEYYDVKSHDWVLNPGYFNIYIGSSSADIRLVEEVLM